MDRIVCVRLWLELPRCTTLPPIKGRRLQRRLTLALTSGLVWEGVQGMRTRCASLPLHSCMLWKRVTLHLTYGLVWEAVLGLRRIRGRAHFFKASRTLQLVILSHLWRLKLYMALMGIRTK